MTLYLLLKCLFICINAVNSNDIIPILNDYYTALTHHRYSMINMYICNETDTLKQYIINYQISTVNTINNKFKIRHYKCINEDTRNIGIIYEITLEYSATKWNNYQSKCMHYNITHNITMNSINNNTCIESIHVLNDTISYYNDNNNTICNKDIEYIRNNELNIKIDIPSLIHYDYKTVTIIFKILGCFSWTLCNIILHLGLLNYPTIFHTKSLIFSTFIASMTNVALTQKMSDLFTYLPNAISLILSILHFITWAYHLQFNLSSKKLISFNRGTRRSIITSPSNTNSLSKRNQASRSFIKVNI